jgi:hypothetical protein
VDRARGETIRVIGPAGEARWIVFGRDDGVGEWLAGGSGPGRLYGGRVAGTLIGDAGDSDSYRSGEGAESIADGEAAGFIGFFTGPATGAIGAGAGSLRA